MSASSGRAIRRAALLFGVAAAAAVGVGLAWRPLVVDRIERQLTAKLGRTVRVGSAYPGWRTLVLRDVVVWGAAPFAHAVLARADRVEIRPGSGSLRQPEEVVLQGVEVDYLRAPTADNLHGQLAAPKDGRSSVHKLETRVRVLSGRARAFIHLDDGWRVTARLEDLTAERAGSDAPLTARAAHGTVEVLGKASSTAAGISVELDPGARSGAFRLESVSAHLPGAMSRLDQLTIEGRFSPPQLTVEARRGQPGKYGSLRALVEVGPRSASALIDGLEMPLAPLQPLAGPVGLGLEAATISLHASIDVHPSERDVAFVADLKTAGLAIHHAAVDRARWNDISGSGQLRGRLELGPSTTLRLQQSRVEALGVPVSLEGWLQLAPLGRGQVQFASGARGAFAEPESVACAGLLGRQPAPVRGALAGLNLDGELKFRGSMSFDVPERQVVALQVEVPRRCQVLREPAAVEAINLLGEEVAYTVDDAAGKETPFPLGRTNPAFVPFSAMPKPLISAFITAEDSSFFRHRGFDLENIRRAIGFNLRASRFARGASTISQQLVKNVLLRPERNLARKLEEAVLTWRVESLLPKERILELYLNAIELGPGIYGVKNAAKAYFGKTLDQLTPLECVHLAALTPNPTVYARQFEGGEVDPAWRRHLEELMAIMKRRKLLSPEELAAAQTAKLRVRSL